MHNMAVLPFSQILIKFYTVNLMRFNTSKCKQMIISRKKSQSVASALSLSGQVLDLELVNHYEYLHRQICHGITIFSVSAPKPEKLWASFTDSFQAMWIALL